MDIRQYKETLERIRNPYRAWTKEREEALRAERELNKISGDIKNEARTEIESLYCFFRLGEGLLDPDFFQRVNAYRVQWRAEHENKEPEIIYFDEDQCDFDGNTEEIRAVIPERKQIKNRRNPYFKPDFAPDTLDAFCYFGGLTLVERGLVKRVESEKKNANKSSAFLRACALSSEGILHIPEVLYHTLSENDYSYPEGSGELLGGAGESCGGEKTPATEVKSQKETHDIIDVVILSKDHPELLETCVCGLRRTEEEEGCSLTVTVVDNGSREDRRKEYEGLAGKYNFRYLFRPGEFHYSKQCNLGAAEENNKYLLFLNDDVEIPPKMAFLRKMASVSEGLHVGAVGIKLLYPDGEHIQHAGISLLRTGPSHKLSGYSDTVSYYHGVNRRDGNFLAVTGACLMVEREKFQKAGGFDERFRVAYTDTDLCMKLYEAGFFSVCLNSLYLYHHESLSRGDDQKDLEGFKRLLEERKLFTRLHAGALKNGDPFYSPLLTDTGLDYRVKFPLPEESLKCEEAPVPFSRKDYRLKDGGRKFLYSLDSAEYHFEDACGNEDFFELRGWAFISGNPGYLYDVLILLRDTGTGEESRLPVSRVLREDLKKVFPKERDTELCGFVSRVSRKALGEEAEYKVSIALVKPGLFGKIRGEIRENICQIRRNGI